eukprot:scaffold3822_cov42-Attheya_sp.AAC.1
MVRIILGGKGFVRFSFFGIGIGVGIGWVVAELGTVNASFHEVIEAFFFVFGSNDGSVASASLGGQFGRTGWSIKGQDDAALWHGQRTTLVQFLEHHGERMSLTPGPPQRDMQQLIDINQDMIKFITRMRPLRRQGRASPRLAPEQKIQPLLL